jgi:O-antigen ligase
MLFINIGKIKLSNKLFSKADFFLMLAFMSLLASTVFNANNKSLGYILAMFFTIFIINFLMRIAMWNFSNLNKILFANAVGVSIIAVISIIEFVLFVYFHKTFNSFLGLNFYQPVIYRGGLFIRVHAFTDEPAYLAYYINTMGPLAIYYIKNLNMNIFFKNILYVVIITSFLLTFSAAGYLALTISLFLYFILKLCSNNSFKHVVSYIFIGIFIMVVIYFFDFLNFVNINEIISPMLEKIMLKNNSSASIRLLNWHIGIQLFKESPFIGYGLGFVSKEIGSIFSVYMLLLLEGGVFALLFYVLFILHVLYDIIRYNDSFSGYILIGYISACIQLSVISLFYLPFIWVLNNIFYIYKLNNKLIN